MLGRWAAMHQPMAPGGAAILGWGYHISVLVTSFTHLQRRGIAGRDGWRGGRVVEHGGKWVVSGEWWGVRGGERGVSGGW